VVIMRDAYAALAHARALPYVDGRRVGLMGGSHGGSTTLAWMAAPQNTWDLLALLILIGEKDDWTPAAPCVKLAASTRATEHPVAITVYPGAHHSFDSDRPGPSWRPG
jgi:dienelactone hydrolase